MKFKNKPKGFGSKLDIMLGECLDIQEENLASVEYLLSQSMKGHHFIFSTEDIKHALGAPLNGIQNFEYEDREKVQEVFLEFLQKKSFKEKQNFLNSITISKKEVLIKAYFHIVENTIKKCYSHQH